MTNSEKIRSVVVEPGTYFISFAYPQGFGNNWLEVKTVASIPEVEKMLAERHECKKVIILNYQKAKLGFFKK